MIHPKQIKNVLSSSKLFNSSLVVLCQLIDTIGNQLISAHDLSALFAPSLNEDQKKWLQDNIYKGSMANISYEGIRSELVHDISTTDISFGETQHKGYPLPNVDWNLLYPSLKNIVNILKNAAQSSGKWWWE